MGGAAVLTSFFGSPQNPTKGEAKAEQSTVEEPQPQSGDADMQDVQASPAPSAEGEEAAAPTQQENVAPDAPAAAKVPFPIRRARADDPEA